MRAHLYRNMLSWYIILSIATYKISLKSRQVSKIQFWSNGIFLYICMWKMINNKSISRYLQIVSITSPWLTSDPLGQVLGLHLQWDHRSALWDCKIQVQKWSIQVMQRSQRWWSYKLMAPNTSFNVLRAFQQAHNEFGVGIIHEWLFHSFAQPKTLGFTAATTSIIPDFVFLSHREITFFPYCLWWYLLTISYQGSGGADQLIMIKEAKTMEGRYLKNTKLLRKTM